jgi:hypothetical protein
VAHLQFQLGHSSLQFEQLHVEGGLLAAHCRHLLLNARVLGFLMGVVPFHFFFDLEILIGERLADFLGLESEHAFKSLFLASQHLHFLLVVVELLGKSLDHIFEGDELALQVGCVRCDATLGRRALSNEWTALGPIAHLRLEHAACVIQVFAVLKLVQRGFYWMDEVSWLR